MAFQSAHTLQTWVDEFRDLGYPSAGTLRVLSRDGDAPTDAGLLTVHLADADTSIYIEPESGTSERWVITLEARDEAITLDPAAMFRLAAELASVSALCAFLEMKSRTAVADLGG